MAIQWSYVLPDPNSYATWSEFDGDLACLRQTGYDAVELQITNPMEFDEARVRESLGRVGYSMCAFQTGNSYYTRGNCLSTPDDAVRQRTIALLRQFIDLAARWNSVIVVGSLQGKRKDEPDKKIGEARIEAAIKELGSYATEKGVRITFEPVNHEEIGFHNTIASVAAMVRRVNQPGLRMMIDAFHMNIEERDMLAPLPEIADILRHVHLSETNRDLLGTGHWDTRAFIKKLNEIGFSGHCSIGVYNTATPRRECIARSMKFIRSL